MNFGRIVRIAYSVIAGLAAGIAAYFIFSLLGWLLMWLVTILGTVWAAATVYNWSADPNATLAAAAVITGISGAFVANDMAGITRSAYSKVTGMFKRSETVAA